MADGGKLADVAKMSFEDALEELEDIVRTLDDGKGKLEDAITAYERGTKLKAHCEKKLKAAQAKVETISLSADGEVAAEPADIE
ncbi:MAG: exodeoxyribonuclease VII small subunit [Rhodospirillaceae bacterium]|nr:MAG: exodeoxyribonuclease VII small subunit [Rhodospirillaceae bacterium]|tara:strand:+ start:230 stop:481 length:252 start_codon:yes stop_codon:yes gene_type:complete